MQDSSIGSHHEELQVMRPRTIGGHYAFAVWRMPPGHAAIRLIFNVLRAADEILLQVRKNRFLGKGHVPQAIASTSSFSI